MVSVCTTSLTIRNHFHFLCQYNPESACQPYLLNPNPYVNVWSKGLCRSEDLRSWDRTKFWSQEVLKLPSIGFHSNY